MKRSTKIAATCFSAQIALTIVVLIVLQLGEVPLRFPVQTAVGLASGFAWTIAVSGWLADKLSADKPLSYLGGVLFTESAVVVSIASGTMLGLMVATPQDCHDLSVMCVYVYLVSPMFWAVFLGGLPAAVMGVVFTGWVGRQPPNNRDESS